MFYVSPGATVTDALVFPFYHLIIVLFDRTTRKGGQIFV